MRACVRACVRARGHAGTRARGHAGTRAAGTRARGHTCVQEVVWQVKTKGSDEEKCDALEAKRKLVALLQTKYTEAANRKQQAEEAQLSRNTTAEQDHEGQEMESIVDCMTEVVEKINCELVTLSSEQAGHPAAFKPLLWRARAASNDLMDCMLELDGISVSAEQRPKRKALVLRIQGLLDCADAVHDELETAQNAAAERAKGAQAMLAEGMPVVSPLSLPTRKEDARMATPEVDCEAHLDKTYTPCEPVCQLYSHSDEGQQMEEV